MIADLGQPLVPLLQKALDAGWLRQQVISYNIANASTPNYKRWDVDFGKIFKEKAACSLPLARTHHAHFAEKESGISGLIYRDLQSRLRNDGNNVDPDAEMALQAATVLQYNLLTRLVSDHLNMLQTAITEGR